MPCNQWFRILYLRIPGTFHESVLNPEQGQINKKTQNLIANVFWTYLRFICGATPGGPLTDSLD